MATGRGPHAGIEQHEDSEARRAERVPPATAAAAAVQTGMLTPQAALAVQRSAGNRSARTLARTAAEQQFALTHEGQVESVQEFIEGVPQLKESDVDEFVLWNFLVDSTVVRRGHKAVIDAVAARWAGELSADPNLRIRVIGYASVTGGVALNEDLAEGRAESVRDHLVDLGISEDQIVIDSSGSRLPMDEGDSPRSLARNRRVEISKFVATTLVGSQTDVDPSLNARITDMRMTTQGKVKDELRDGHIVFTMEPAVLQAGIAAATFEPDVEVGALQFVTFDFRRGAYSAEDGSGEVEDFRAPPIAVADYDHCLNAFTPCRDVELAKAPFSGAPNGAFTTVRPSPTPQSLIFKTRPHVAFPIEIDVPGNGRAILTAGKWQMTFTVLLVARKGGVIVPLDSHAEWDLDVSIKLPLGPDPKTLSRLLTTNISVNSRTGLFATGPIPDVERAMTRPTADLRQKMMDRICMPTIAPAPPGDFDAALTEAEDELRRAAGQLLPR